MSRLHIHQLQGWLRAVAYTVDIRRVVFVTSLVEVLCSADVASRGASRVPARHLRWPVAPRAPAARPVTQLALGAATTSSLGDCLPSLPRGSQPAPRGGLSRRRPHLKDPSSKNLYFFLVPTRSELLNLTGAYETYVLRTLLRLVPSSLTTKLGSGADKHLEKSLGRRSCLILDFSFLSE